MNRAARFQLKSQNAVTGVLMTVLLGLGAYAASRYDVRWDWTAERRYTLEEQSVKAAKAFPEGLTATVYVMGKGKERDLGRDLLEKYRGINPKLELKFVDLEERPGEARRDDVTYVGTVILRSGERKEKVAELTEEAVTNGLIRLARGAETKVVRFITGHGELPLAPPQEMGKSKANAYQTVAKWMKGEGYQVEPLNLAAEEKIPDKTAVVVAAGPRTPLFPVEVERLEAWMKEGGRLLVMADPDAVTGLEGYLQTEGVNLLSGIVIDPAAKLVGGGPTTPLIHRYDDHHPISQGINTAAFLLEARGLELLPAPEKSPAKRTALMWGGENGWLEKGSLASGSVSFDPAQDVKGPVLLGAAVEEGKRRLVVVGDSEFASDGYVGAAGNGNLFLNMVRWLAEDESFIAIKPKQVKDGELYIPGMAGLVLAWTLVVIMPLSLIIAGVTIWRRRSRL
ncbi:MAG: GldG family protein [Magnetococcales bacterium]|nr:GldG family protein [Magnetococcales bacterium]